MPKFTFTITYKDDSIYPVELDLPDRRTAWSEAVVACGEAMEDIDGTFGENDEWLLTVTDAAGKPAFEIRCISRHFSANDD